MSCDCITVETTSEVVSIKTTTLDEVIQVGVVGPQGPQGLQGPQGPTGARTFELKTEDFAADVNRSYACDTSATETIPEQFSSITLGGLVFTNLTPNLVSLEIRNSEDSLFIVSDGPFFSIFVDITAYTLQDIIDVVEDYDTIITVALADGFVGTDYMTETPYFGYIAAAVPASSSYIPFIITLPAAELGETIVIADAVGTWNVNAPILTSAELIEGESDNYSVQESGSTTLLYIGESIGWKVVEGFKTKGGFSREPATGSNGGIVQWANSGFDTTGGFDVANSRFVVPTGKAGLYAFNAAIYYDLPSDTQVELGIYVNNVRVRAFYTGTFDGTQGQAQVFGIIPMEEDDIVTVTVNFFGDQDAVVRPDPGVSWFTGVQL